MADIIEFSSKKDSNEMFSTDDLVNALLTEILKISGNIDDFVILFKTSDGERIMLHTGLDLEDKCVFSCILQQDINADLNNSTNPLKESDF